MSLRKNSIDAICNFISLYFFPLMNTESSSAQASTKKNLDLFFRYASYLQPKYTLVLVVLNSTLSSILAPRLFIEFPNQVEDKLWALTIPYNLNCYEN